MVVLIASILAVFALPSLTSAPAVSLAATTAQVATSIRYAQSLAQSRGQRFRVNFTANTYQVTDMGGAPVVQPIGGGTGPVSIAPATLSGYNPPLTGSFVAFDTRGVPYVSATAALAAAATITVTSGADAASIVISPETGRVK